MIHVDVMDGHFVPVITFGPRMVASVADLIHEHGGFADVHLMIEQPERHLEQFAAAGADGITVHVETYPTCTTRCMKSGSSGAGLESPSTPALRSRPSRRPSATPTCSCA